MIKIPIDFDTSGYAYDNQNPSEQSELFFYKLSSIIDESKTQGLEIRQAEPADITAIETEISTMFGLTITPPEEPVTIVTPTNTDMLLDGSIYEVLNKARTAWLASINASIVSGEPASDSLAAINETLKMMLLQEPIVYLSDGTPIYGHMGQVA